MQRNKDETYEGGVAGKNAVNQGRYHRIRRLEGDHILATRAVRY